MNQVWECFKGFTYKVEKSKVKSNKKTFIKELKLTEHSTISLVKKLIYNEILCEGEFKKLNEEKQTPPRIS